MKLWVCHRLDKETSGAIVFASDQKGAADLSRLFEEKQVKKRYLFITSSQAPFRLIEVASRIERRGNEFVSIPCRAKEANAFTRFLPLLEWERFQLWEAQPLSGKPHQIRLHAAASQMPILGDLLYGGEKAPRLMLHAHSLSFELDEEYEHTSPPPRYFEDLSLLKDPLLIELLSALHRRNMVFTVDEHECLRLLHREREELRCDRYGEVGWYYWYGDKPPGQRALSAFDVIAEEAHSPHWYCSIMENRGKAESAHKLISSPHPPSSWTAEEEGIKYVISAERGRSPGLFLDQRLNRRFIRDIAQDKRVLNLFCYTGGFSLAAALGGARDVVSVDTSRQALEWAKENFQLNELDPSPFRFIHEDAREYLKRCVRQKREFDIVICDPPSFARSKTGIFSLEKDLESLFELLLSVTKEHLLFCTNLEKLTSDALLRRASTISKGTPFRHISLLPGDLDLELPGEAPLMKSILFSTR